MLRRQATDQERQAIWETLLFRSNRGVLAYGKIAQAAEEFGFHRSAVSRMWKRGSAAMGTGVAADVKSHKHERGREKVDRVSICNRIAQSASAKSRPQLPGFRLFASIQSVQSRTTSCTIQDIIQEVEHACEIMTAETLNKTFLTLPLVMKEIMNCEGRNDFKLAHFHKDKLIRAGKLPASLQCDTTSFGLAQQSILALAVASWIDPPLPQASTQPSPRSPPLSPPSPTHFDPFLYF